MLGFIKRVNARYDRIQEPARFLWFICPIIVCAVITAVAPVLGWSLLVSLALFRILGKQW